MYALIFACIGAFPSLAYAVTTLGDPVAGHDAITLFVLATSATGLIGLLVEWLARRHRRSRSVLPNRRDDRWERSAFMDSDFDA